MAICLDSQSSVAPPAAGAALTTFDAVQSAYPVLWKRGDAVKTDGVYTCPKGSFLLLTPSEFSGNQWTTADAVSIGWSIATVWLLVYAVMFVSRSVRNWGDSNDSIT